MQDQSLASIREAIPGDIEAIVDADAYAQAHVSRRNFIECAVTDGQCLVATGSDGVLGFVVLTHNFFEQGFIPLVIVAQEHRRRGIALQLLRAAESACRTAKLFTSTNRSNVAAQALLSKAGFIRSGIIENLDLDDPELVYCKWCRDQSDS